MICRTLFLTFSFILATILNANAITICGNPAQGEILKGKIDSDAKKITFNDRKVFISDKGYFLLALGRDEDKTASFNIDGTKYVFGVNPTKWDIQNIKGLPQKHVTPSKQDQTAIERERKDIRTAQKQDTKSDHWKTGFIKPVEGRISGNFGGQRILNGEKRNPHLGMDIAAPEGTEIKASSDGIISLAGFDYFYSGHVVVIDHGHNLYTLYAHMKDISVKKGDSIKQGETIGTVGKTGRATGPHLHWGASLNGVRFNPQSLLNINNNDSCFNL